MHSYSSAHGNMVGQCPCGLFHPHNQCSSSYSTLWPASSTDHFYSPSPSVDCTLSLGTPSTRRSSSSTDTTNPRRSSAARLSNFCWDFLQPKHSSASTPKSTSQLYRSSNNNIHTPTTTTNCSSGGGDPLLSRRCANCDTTSTPLWRNGPKGPKSLCNACGIRFKKEERRATAAAATGCNPAGGILESHVAGGYYNNSNGSSSWGHPSAQKVQHYLSAPAMGNDFRFIDHDVDTAHFLSWRLNVTDKPTPLVHDFTR